MQRRTRYDSLLSLRWVPLFDAPTLHPITQRARNLGTTFIAQGLEAGMDELAALYGMLGISAQPSDDGLIHLPAAELPSAYELPKGYGFKGGAARAALAAAISRHSACSVGESSVRPRAYPAYGAPSEPRDYDLVRIGSSWTDADTELSKKFMREDFERGSGVELVRRWSDYFRSRDLTVNEVMLLDGSVVVSPLGLADTIGRVLRPCRYVGGSLRRVRTIRSQTAVKMIRLAAEAKSRGEDWQVAGVPPQQNVRDFDIALQLERALSHSEHCAENFIQLLGRLGVAVVDEQEQVRNSLLAWCEEFAPELSSDSRLSQYICSRQTSA